MYLLIKISKENVKLTKGSAQKVFGIKPLAVHWVWSDRVRCCGHELRPCQHTIHFDYY